VPAVSGRHHAKVYGKAAEGSPPMSVPHLDTRFVAGSKSLLFGPYAGFSTRFLKHGSLTDLFRSIEPGNIMPMLAVARDNVALSEYLIGQVLQTSAHQFAMLQQFFPTAKRHNFPDELTESAWLPKLKQIVPTYGIDLTRDADACRRIRAETPPVLKIENL
jgi:malate dehydrogenase (quinone)